MPLTLRPGHTCAPSISRPPKQPKKQSDIHSVILCFLRAQRASLLSWSRSRIYLLHRFLTFHLSNPIFCLRTTHLFISHCSAFGPDFQGVGYERCPIPAIFQIIIFFPILTLHWQARHANDCCTTPNLSLATRWSGGQRCCFTARSLRVPSLCNLHVLPVCIGGLSPGTPNSSHSSKT